MYETRLIKYIKITFYIMKSNYIFPLFMIIEGINSYLRQIFSDLRNLSDNVETFW